MRLDDFDIGRQLGSGGMGAVYLVTHRSTGTQAGLKVMTGESHRDPRYRRMFRREAESLARLDHPNIVRVYDVGAVEAGTRAAEQFGKGSPYLVMEYIEGATPAEFFRARGRFGWPDLEHLLEEVLGALAHAHAFNVIHRDLKPNNLLIQGDAHAGDWSTTLFDFGIARALDDLSVRKKTTTRGRVIGTPKFMAPEQVLGNWRDQGPSTDLYALGCLAWQACTGSAPFDGDSNMGVLLGHINQPPPKFEPLFDVPNGLEGWLRHLLEKSPYARPNRAADAAEALRNLGEVESRVDDHTMPDVVNTLLDPTRSETFRLPDHVETSHDEPEEPMASEAAAHPLPAVAEDWRQYRRHGEHRAVDRGLGLFGLRRPAPTGREAERDRMWSQLLSSIETRAVRSVTLRGEAGLGKSRLAKWLETLAHEIGAATTLSATHSPFGGPLDGLAPMFMRFFRARGLDQTDVATRLRKRLGSLFDESSELNFAVTTLSRLVATETDVQQSDSVRLSPAERHAAMASTLHALAMQRPVIVWLDDVQWGQRAVDFAQHLLADPGSNAASLLVVSTIRQSDHAALDEPLRMLIDHQANADIKLAPLDDSDQGGVIENLLAVAPAVRSQLVERTHGNPLMAEQLLFDLVERDALRRTQRTYDVTEPIDSLLPDGLSDLWWRRIETISRTLPEQRRAEALLALETAAALGQDVSRREWETACDHADLDVPDVLLSELSARGLASLGRGGWSFEHSLLRDSLEERARDRGTWDRVNESCLEMLRELYTEEAPDFFERRAHFLHAAGHVRPALADMLRAYHRARDTESTARRRQLMALAERWSHELSLNDDDQLRAKIDLCRALEANDEGSLDAAADISRAVCQRADANGWTTIRGLARLHLANCQLLRGTTDASLEMVKSGILDLESADDPDAIETLASGLLLLGNHARRNGRFAEAERSLRRATELLRTTGNRSREIRASLELARCLWQDDREPESRHQIALGLRTAERIQSRAALAEVHHARGELERHKGRLRRALADYRKASRLWASVSTLNRFINELNEALSLLGLGNTAEAAPMLERLEEESRTLGIQAARPLFEVAAAFCHVSRHAFEAASRRLDAVDEVNWASTIAAPDIQWVAMLGVDKAASAGHETLTERFREISGDAS